MTKQLPLTLFEPSQPTRLFLGLWPTATAAEQVTWVAKSLRDRGIMPGRPVDPDRFHVTLVHIADFADQMPRHLITDIHAAIGAFTWQTFDVAFDRVGGTKGPLLLRPSDGAVALHAFRKNLGAALIKGGLRRYVDSAFNPHVTLSYDFSDAPENAVPSIGWSVHEFVLIESLLGRHQHIVRGRWRSSAAN